MSIMVQAKNPTRMQQRPAHLPAWPNMYGGQRQWWVDGVPVRTSWSAIGFAFVVVLPLGVWLEKSNPPGWLAELATLIGFAAYTFVVVPWVMRFADLRRRSAR